MFANGPGDLGSIPGRVIPKTQKMVLDASLLSTHHYKVRIKGKVEQSRKGVAPSPTHWCSSYRKGSLRVTLDYGRQLYFYLLIYIYIYTHPSAQAGCDTRSIFKRSLTGLNSELPKQVSLPYYLLIVRGRIIGIIPFPRI